MDENKEKNDTEIKISKKKVIIIVTIIVLLIGTLIGGLIYHRNAIKEGRIELILIDQNELPVIGAKINLRKVNGDEIGTIETGADGKITYYYVKEDDYVLEVLNMPEGYEIEESSKIANISVEENSTTSVTMKSKRNIGFLKVIVKDELENLMEGINVNIYDKEGYLIVSKTTSDEGVIYHSFLDDGIYYFDLSVNQDIIGKYQLDTTMYKINVDDKNITFIKELKIKKDDIENVVAEEAKNIINVENIVAK